MPTAEQVAKWADDFEESYPEGLADRLRWFHDNLGIEKDRLLRLMGIPSEEVKELRRARWQQVAREYADGAEWAEELLLQAVAYFDYNWEGLRDYLRQPLRDGFLIEQPGQPLPLTALPPAEQDHLLLSLAAEGTERSIPVLLIFLSSTSRQQHTR